MDVYLSNNTGQRIDPVVQCDLLAGPDEIEVSETESKTLEEMEIVLDNNLKKITLLPRYAGIFWADGIAQKDVCPLPAGGVSIDCSKNTISTRQFISNKKPIKMSVIQEGSGY